MLSDKFVLLRCSVELGVPDVAENAFVPDRIFRHVFHAVLECFERAA